MDFIASGGRSTRALVVGQIGDGELAFVEVSKARGDTRFSPGIPGFWPSGVVPPQGFEP